MKILLSGKHCAQENIVLRKTLRLMKILSFGKYWAQEIIALRKTKKIRSKPIISILEAYQAFSKKEVQNTGKQKTNTSKHLKKKQESKYLARCENNYKHP